MERLNSKWKSNQITDPNSIITADVYKSMTMTQTYGLDNFTLSFGGIYAIL